MIILGHTCLGCYFQGSLVHQGHSFYQQNSDYLKNSLVNLSCEIVEERIEDVIGFEVSEDLLKPPFIFSLTLSY